MKNHYDFAKGKRGAVIKLARKTRVTMYLDDSILKQFKSWSSRTGKGYQTLINEALRSASGLDEEALTPKLLRQIVREELDARRSGSTAKSEKSRS